MNARYLYLSFSLFLVIAHLGFSHDPRIMPILGVHLRALPLDYLADNEDMRLFDGILVDGVIDNTPAQKAGLKKGDIICTLDGPYKVIYPQFLARHVQRLPVGRTIAITYTRSGEKFKANIVLDKANENPAPVDRKGWPLESNFSASLQLFCELSYLRKLSDKDLALGLKTWWVSLSLEETRAVIGQLYAHGLYFESSAMNYMLREISRPQTALLPKAPYLGILDSSFIPENRFQKAHKPKPFEGILVTFVTPGSPAKSADIKQNDLITHIDGERVITYFRLKEKLLAKKVGDTMTITVIREGASLDIPVKLDKGLPIGLAFQPDFANEVIRLITAYRELYPGDDFVIKKIDVKDWDGKLFYLGGPRLANKMMEAKVIIEGFEEEMKKGVEMRRKSHKDEDWYEDIRHFDALVNIKKKLDKASTEKE